MRLFKQLPPASEQWRSTEPHLFPLLVDLSSKVKSDDVVCLPRAPRKVSSYLEGETDISQPLRVV